MKENKSLRKRSLSANKAVIWGSLFMSLMFSAVLFNACSKEKYLISDSDPLAAFGIENITPSNFEDSVVLDPEVILTFADETDTSEIASVNLSLVGNGITFPGMAAREGKTVTYTFDKDLEPMTDYTATIFKNPESKGQNSSGDRRYSWKFRTGNKHRMIPLKVISADPPKDTTGVSRNTCLRITMNKVLTSELQNLISVTLKKGQTAIQGTVSYSGNEIIFLPLNPLEPGTKYSAAITLEKENISFAWSFTTAAEPIITDNTPPVVSFVLPAVNASAVATNTQLSVTFSEAMNTSTINNTTFTLRQGTTPVSGNVTYSQNIATFTPASALAGGTLYTATVSSAAKDAAGNSLASSYSWSFTTAAIADVIAPTVSIVTPSANSTGIAVNSALTIKFSEAMNAGTISATTITLKQGSAAVTGTVTYSASTNTATFTPSAALTGGTVYTAAVTTGVKDAAGNSLGSNYTWSFTTVVIADVTAPTVSVITPAANATGIAVNSAVTIKFSEAMNASTISATTIMLVQGTTAVTGTVTYSASTNTATFTPSAALTNGTVYTATVTTGVKDAAGNSLASNYSWSFTTIAAATPVSFSGEVVPILNKCNTCHTHGWTPSSNASTFYTNLVNANYVNPASPTTSKIYSRINSGHPSSTVTLAEKTKILTWMNEGSKNN